MQPICTIVDSARHGTDDSHLSSSVGEHVFWSDHDPAMPKPLATVAEYDDEKQLRSRLRFARRWVRLCLSPRSLRFFRRYLNTVRSMLEAPAASCMRCKREKGKWLQAYDTILSRDCFLCQLVSPDFKDMIVYEIKTYMLSHWLGYRDFAAQSGGHQTEEAPASLSMPEIMQYWNEVFPYVQSQKNIYDRRVAQWSDESPPPSIDDLHYWTAFVRASCFAGLETEYLYHLIETYSDKKQDITTCVHNARADQTSVQPSGPNDNSDCNDSTTQDGEVIYTPRSSECETEAVNSDGYRADSENGSWEHIHVRAGGDLDH